MKSNSTKRKKKDNVKYYIFNGIMVFLLTLWSTLLGVIGNIKSIYLGINLMVLATIIVFYQWGLSKL